jgi:hypothetical protein
MVKRIVRFAGAGLMLIAAVAGSQVAGFAQSSNQAMPVFEVDPSWPKIPNNWVFGWTSAVTVDKRDHVWILQRPGTLPDELKSRAAPPVMEFDNNGKFLNSWGGEGQGYDWPVTPHGITIDNDVVWIGGSGVTDDFLLKFTLQGKFLKEFFAKGISKGNADTRALNRPSDATIYHKTNEVFVSDGYGNRRVIVLDANTGAFKRMWGAFGNPPDNDPPAGGFGGGGGAGGSQKGKGKEEAVVDTEGPGPSHFGNPVHVVKISNDDLVYVADRSNRRIQIFSIDGKYLTQVFINRDIPSQGTAAGIAFSPDPQQEFMYVSDLGNSHVAVLNRKTLQLLYEFGPEGKKPGEFHSPHLISVDSKGNLYTAEVQGGNRAQKFVFKGMSKTLPPNALTPEQLSASK